MGACRRGLVPWWGGRSFDVPPPHGRHSDLAGRLSLLGSAGPRHLRWQSQEPAQSPHQLLPGPGEPAPAHPADGYHRLARAVDGGALRDRGAHARVHVDQGIQSALQRRVQGRQVLSLPRRVHGRALPARAGDPRAQARRLTLLRPLHSGVGNSGDHRSASARLPGAFVLGRGLRSGEGPGAPVPAWLHRQVLGPVR